MEPPLQDLSAVSYCPDIPSIAPNTCHCALPDLLCTSHEVVRPTVYALRQPRNWQDSLLLPTRLLSSHPPAPQPDSPLLSLPYELRHEIFVYLVHSTTQSYTIHSFRKGKHAIRVPRLAGTCRQVLAEYSRVHAAEAPRVASEVRVEIEDWRIKWLVSARERAIARRAGSGVDGGRLKVGYVLRLTEKFERRGWELGLLKENAAMWRELCYGRLLKERVLEDGVSAEGVKGWLEERQRESDREMRETEERRARELEERGHREVRRVGNREDWALRELRRAIGRALDSAPPRQPSRWDR